MTPRTSRLPVKKLRRQLLKREKNIFGDRPPPPSTSSSQGLDDRASPLSEGLDLPLCFTNACFCGLDGVKRPRAFQSF